MSLFQLSDADGNDLVSNFFEQDLPLPIIETSKDPPVDRGTDLEVMKDLQLSDQKSLLIQAVLEGQDLANLDVVEKVFCREIPPK